MNRGLTAMTFCNRHGKDLCRRLGGRTNFVRLPRQRFTFPTMNVRIAREMGQTKMDRYAEASDNSDAENFFDSGNSETDETMSQTEPLSKTVSNGEERTITANETSDFYISVGHLTASASGLVNAKEGMNLNFSGKSGDELPAQVRYVKALHEVKSDIGKRQRKAEGNVTIGFGSEDWYAGNFGAELPTIETESIDGGILSLLKKQEGEAVDDNGEPTWPEGSTDELGQGLPILLPVIDGEALPVFVKESNIEAALERVAKIPREPAVAPVPEQKSEQESDEGGDNESLEGFFGEDTEPETASVEMPSEFPNPADLSVGDIREFVTEIENAGHAQAMLEAEMKGKNRDTAIKALEGRSNRLMQQSESNKETSQDEVTEAVEGESSPEAKAELANTLINRGMDPEEALDRVQNL